MAVALLGVVTGCGESAERGQVGYVEGFYGAVVADEPRAAEIGRDILTSGGNAIDAAVATYFAMAVTLPSSASLGGGGVCLVHNRVTRKVDAITFLPKASGGALPMATPANARGMALLHAGRGAFRWEEVVAPAERLARLGTPVSRAFARDLSLAARNLAQDPNARRIFLRPDGSPMMEGDNLVQPGLAGVLGAIRVKGAGDLNGGQSGRDFVAGTRPLGGAVTIEELRDTVPVASAPIQVRVGSELASFPPPPVGGGTLTAELWQLVASYGNVGAAGNSIQHVMAEMSKRAYADRSNWLDLTDRFVEDPAAILDDARLRQLAAGFGNQATPVGALTRQPRQRPADPPGVASWLTVDRFGNAVVCSVSTFGIFGIGGRVAGDTGIVVGAPPVVNGRASASLAPVLIANPNTGDFYFAGAPSGGTPAPAAVVQTMALVLLAKMPLPDAVATSRAVHLGAPDVVYAEPGDGSAVSDLRARGHTVQELGPLGTVAAFYCPEGARSRSSGCQAAADRRGHGLALTAHQR